FGLLKRRTELPRYYYSPCPLQQRDSFCDKLVSTRETYADTKLSRRNPPLLYLDIPVRHVTASELKAHSSGLVGLQVDLFETAERLWRSSRWQSRLGWSYIELRNSCAGNGTCVCYRHSS